MNQFADNILKILKSRKFFIFIIILFLFEASWIALTASYPQAFDENFHFGLIQVYSHYWLPFLHGQPPNADAYGAVARDPSYLYHYLMSFPYRVIAHFVHRETYQIIILRFINIALFASGIVLFKKVLIRAKLSEGQANLTLLLFCLIPIVPQLAGQINYDNMLFPLVAAVCLLTFNLIDQLKKNKPLFRTAVYLLIICTLTSLVKYAFLPIFLSIIVFISYQLLWKYRHHLKLIFNNLAKDFLKNKLWLNIILISLLAISIGLFAQRDVVNLVKYHSVEPDCGLVLNVKACSNYRPWYADYTRHIKVLTKQAAPASQNLIFYMAQWIYWMWYRLFFAVNGPATSFENFPPLPLPSAIAALIGFIGVIAVIKFRKLLFKSNPYAMFMLVACIFYVLALGIQGYVTYQYTGILENMNGRYLLPILLLAIALFGKAFSIALRNSPTAKVLLSCFVIVMFLQGGGIITFISRSSDSWDWQNKKVLRVNNTARNITNKIIIKGTKYYHTPYWFFN